MAKPVRAVERVVRILLYLNQFNGLNSNQVALGTKLSRGTAYRMLETLRVEGLVETHHDDGRYWLTRKVRQLADGFDDEEWISSIARPEMNRLTKAIAWPVMLTTAGGIEMVLRATTDPQTSLLFRRHTVGHVVPILGSAAGRCYLAYCTKNRRDAVLELIIKMAPNPWPEVASNRTAVQKILAGIRRQRLSVSETPDRRSMSLAVPILIKGEPLAVLGMRHFKSAMTEAEAIRRFAGPLQRSAAWIGEQWLREQSATERIKAGFKDPT